MVDLKSVHFTPAQRRIYAFIKERGGEGCSKSEIAEKVGCGMKTVDRAITHLRKAGVIRVKSHYAEHGGQLPNSYRTVEDDDQA